MALRLSRLFGNSAELWLNAQRGVALWVAAHALTDDVARIKPLRLASQTVAPDSRTIERALRALACLRPQVYRGVRQTSISPDREAPGAASGVNAVGTSCGIPTAYLRPGQERA